MTSVSGVVGGVYAFRGGGSVVALRGYFDDSGSHDDSEIVVWAGWLGTTDQWEAVEPEWEHILRAHGVPGAFHMHECATSEIAGGFGNRANRDSLMHDLRQLLLTTKLTAVGVGVVRSAWSVAPDWLRGPVSDANHAAAALCLSQVQHLLERHRAKLTTPLALYFDVGATNSVKAILKIMGSSFNEIAKRADAVSFAKVADSPALQAADMIAWSLRDDMRNYGIAGEARPFNPHFRQFVEHGALDHSVIDHDAVEAMRKRGPPPGWISPF